MTNQYFTNACTVVHAYPVDYFHGISSKTTAYIRNNAILNVLLGLSKRTSKTFFVALAKTYAGYCFAVNIYYSCKLKLQITVDRFLPFLTMSAQSRFSALPQLRHSPNFPYGEFEIGRSLPWSVALGSSSSSNSRIPTYQKCPIYILIFHN